MPDFLADLKFIKKNPKKRNILSGHRFRPAYDFDYVALDLLSVYPEDSGVYACHARNAYGEAVSSATIKIFGKLCHDFVFFFQYCAQIQRYTYFFTFYLLFLVSGQEKLQLINKFKCIFGDIVKSSNSATYTRKGF